MSSQIHNLVKSATDMVFNVVQSTGIWTRRSVLQMTSERSNVTKCITQQLKQLLVNKQLLPFFIRLGARYVIHKSCNVSSYNIRGSKRVLVVRIAPHFPSRATTHTTALQRSSGRDKASGVIMRNDGGLREGRGGEMGVTSLWFPNRILWCLCNRRPALRSLACANRPK